MDIDFMEKINFFASPWWVNLLLLVPLTVYFYWRHKLNITTKILIITGIFGIAFGFLEATVVVYIRAAVGLLPAGLELPQAAIVEQMPAVILRTEIMREAATIIMLSSIGVVAVHAWRERLAVFFWTFAIWDIVYYFGLKFLIGWPESLLTNDVLFLIPSPWYSQVWFPVLVSSLMIIAVYFGRSKNYWFKIN